jgi:pimeloyl-ACP methyl ester carboxylesterase
MISIPNKAESKEVQMTLELGGAYLLVDVPGGGERGANWFRSGAQNRDYALSYVAKASQFAQKKFNLSKKFISVLGRSWGGAFSYSLARDHGNQFGFIFSAATPINIIDDMEGTKLGRIIISDHFPNITRNGDYITDKTFIERIKALSPNLVYKDIDPSIKFGLFIAGLDDTVNNGKQETIDHIRSLNNHFDKDNFYFSTDSQGLHGSRFYQPIIFSILVNEYNINL